MALTGATMDATPKTSQPFTNPAPKDVHDGVLQRTAKTLVTAAAIPLAGIAGATQQVVSRVNYNLHGKREAEQKMKDLDVEEHNEK